MKVRTTRFGEAEVSEEDVLRFPEGILGFSRLKEYALLKLEGEVPLLWLQSTEEAEVAFIVCDPVSFKLDYQVRVTREELESIGLGEASEGRVLVILTIGVEPSLTTANLQGPLIINVKEKLAKQVVLLGDEYTTKYPIFENAGAGREGAEGGKR